MEFLQPVFTRAEADAVRALIRGTLDGRLLVEADEDLIRHAADAIEHARGVDSGANGVPPSSRGSATSREAALRKFPKSGTDRATALEAVLAAGERGVTRDELAEILGKPDSGTDARVWELLKGGFVIETGRSRKTRAGQQAAVLVASEKARRVAVPR